ncbi:MAG: 6-bladed beta-propeller [Prevotellaceae bacterium]|jgi:hypothetical protein|nr:6-bladed beta-propeller [Prevotellaceae bacterium]
MKRSSILPIFIIGMLSAFGLTACHEDTSETDYFLIELDKLTDKVKVGTTLNDIAESVRVIPVETSDSVLFGSLSIVGATDTHILAYNISNSAMYQYVCMIDKEDGSVHIFLNKYGQGPGEYSSMSNVFMESDTVVSLYSDNKYMRYNLQGKYLGSVSTDSINAYARLPDGNYYVTQPYTSPAPYRTAVYDENGQLIRNGIPNDRPAAEYGFRVIGKELPVYNDRLFYREFYGDTLYQVTTEADKPYIVLRLGALKLPPELITAYQQLVNPSNNHIRFVTVYVASHYCFLVFIYNQDYYYSIWDMDNGELVYANNTAHLSTDESAGTTTKRPSATIPVTVNNVELNAWPMYCDNNTIYCIINPTNVLKLYPNAPEDTNPMILEVKLK